MKILAFSYDYRPATGGIATCAYELLRALARIPGVEVRLIAPAASGGETFDQRSGVHTRRIALSCRPEYAAFQAVRELRREYAAFTPDVVLNFLWLPDGSATRLAFGNRARSYVLAHGVEVLEARSTLRKRVRALLAGWKRGVFRDAAGVFAVSRYTAELVRDRCAVPAERIAVIYNGVDTARFSPGPPSASLRDRYGLHGKKVILTVTRLVDYKGIDVTLHALREVREEFPDVQYLIGGEGADRARIERLAADLGLTDRVRFLGPIAGEELPDYFRLADVFVMPSRSDLVTPNIEGFGLVYLEAAGCGKPSIAGHAGGVPDAVIDGETGWLVNPENPRDVARAMRECFLNPAGAAKRGEQARLRVEETFQWKHVAERVLDEFRKGPRHVRN